MSPDRLSRRVALSLVFLVTMLAFVISGCKKEAPPSTESAAEPAMTQTATAAQQPLAAQTTGTPTTTDTATTLAAQEAAVPCTGPDLARARPVVCIDAKTLKTNPKSITMIDFEPGPDNKPTGTPVRIYWRTTTGTGSLKVKFADNNKCVTPPNCNKPGECSATALPHQKPRESTTCDYQVWLDGKDADPVIIVDPCCP